jgi:hypothetical protein
VDQKKICKRVKAQRSLATADDVHSVQSSTVTCVKIKKQFINVSGTTKIMCTDETASEINVTCKGYA